MNGLEQKLWTPWMTFIESIVMPLAKTYRFLRCLLLFGGILPAQVWANMASPLVAGTATGLPFVSQHARVIHERINMRIDAAFEYCTFEITYDIVTDTAGLRIPLLFVAHDYAAEMAVTVNGQPVEILALPTYYYYQERSPLSSFLQKDGDSIHELQTYQIAWREGEVFSYNQEELHYFELDLPAGQHQICVRYTASPWKYKGEWLQDLEFKYALKPASYWYDFGQLDVTLDAQQSPLAVLTNLGEPDSGSLDKIAAWHFDKMPDLEIINVQAESKAQGWGPFWMGFGMEGFLWTSGIIGAAIHLLLMWWWRKRNPQTMFSWVWLVGVLLVPFVAMVVYTASYSWISASIGPSASNRNGYYFLIFIFYPIAMPVYALLTAGLGYLFKKRFQSAN